MKLLFFKILMKLLNVIFKIIYGVSYSTYKATLTNRSFDSMTSILLWMHFSLKKKYPKFTINNQHVAEIGAGQFLSHPIGLILLGAKKVTTFDLYRQFNQKAAILSFNQQLMSKKILSAFAPSNKYSKIMDKINKSNFDLNELENYGIQYIAPFNINNYKENECFDLIISYTVLEHVSNNKIPELIIKSVKTLKHGGYFCHFIDMEDHKDHDNNPFEFLSSNNWTETDCFFRGNRLRLNDWDKIFNQIQGIEYEFVSILERNEELLPKGIARELNNYASGILVIGKKLY